VSDDAERAAASRELQQWVLYREMLRRQLKDADAKVDVLLEQRREAS
jgi:hypothetical protein